MQENVLAKWLRWLVYATALIPLVIFSQYQSPFHFGKVIVFRSIVQVMVALYLLLIWRDGSYRPKGHPILWAFVAFTGAFALTTLTSVAQLQSFWGTIERMGGLFTFVHYLVFVVIAGAVLRTRRDWHVLLNLIVAAGVVSACYGFLQKTHWSFILGSGGRARPFGTIGNPALFAGYEILAAFLALTLSFLQDATYRWRTWYRSAAGIMLLAVASTAVRGSLLAVAVALLAFALLWSVVNRSRKAKLALLGGISVVILFFFAALALRNTSLVTGSPYLTRITAFSPQTFTVQTRFWAWSAGFKGWSESPKTVLLGWGPENFNIPFSKYFNPKFFTGPGSETFFDRAHNMFIEVLVTMGLVGFVTYVSLFVAVFWTLVRFMRGTGVASPEQKDLRVIGIGFTAMTIAYMIHNAFIFDTSANFLTFFTLCAFMVFLARGGGAGRAVPVQKRGGRTPWTGAQIAAAGVLGFVVLATVSTTNIAPAMANYASTRAIVASWNGDWPTAVKKFREAIDYDVAGRYEYRHRFAQFLLELGATEQAKKISDFAPTVQMAIEDVKKNAVENPRDYLPLLYLSRLYITLGKEDPKSPYNDSALQESAKALEISPTFVRTYYEVAQAYLNKQDFDAAFTWFKKARDLQPEVGITYWYMGVVRSQEATQRNDATMLREALGYMATALEKGYALSEGDTQKLVNLYLQIGDLKTVAALFEELVRINPKNPQYWSSLATVYARVGRTADAIAAARQLLVLSPGDAAVKAQVDAFIRNLGGTP